jgi:Fe-S cluster assembly protein SufD
MSSAPLTSLASETLSGWSERALARATERREPDWAIGHRRRAAALAAALPFPSREDELWRRTDFRTLEAELQSLDPHVPGPAARHLDDLPAGLLTRLAGGSPSALVVQSGAGVTLEQTHPELERQGVIVCSLERALREHAGKLEGHLGAMIDPDYDRWSALADALRSGGAFVFVPAGVQAAVPVRILHWLEGGGRLVAPHTVIVLEKGARITVIEEQSSEAAERPSLHAGATEVFVGDAAHLTYATHQDWARNVYHYSNQRARVGRDAELQWMQTLLGARMVKTNSYFDLAGPGGRAYVNGFMFGDERQHFHLHTLQRHLVDHCTSDLLIKGCLKDRARSVYQGLIQVAEDAQRTDAYQANRNLLLSDTARADSIPGLEILANDVRCTHGATIGTVDEEQMYYLQARGLHHAEAERLIVEGFFTPVLDRIPLESVREQLREAIQRKLGAP